MKTKELNLEKLESYIADAYNYDVSDLVKTLRKLAIDYGRLNTYMCLKEECASVCQQSHNYITILDDIADALEPLKN